MAIIDELLKENPYARTERADFLSAMKESLRHHYRHSEHFPKFIDANNFDVGKVFLVEEIPFLPVSIFKELELVTGNLGDIKKRVFSSATTGNKPSVICLDQVTIDRQRVALTKIMSDFLGAQRKNFIILDSPNVARSTDGEVSSRGSAVRGMLPFALRTFFVLNDDLTINKKELGQALDLLQGDKDISFFGFTWVVYNALKELEKESDYNKDILVRFADLPAHKNLMHLGGWKKLRDLQVEKKDFNALVARHLHMSPSGVIDIYGMTEQLGTVYPDCSAGFKHVPLYSDVIVRDPVTLEPKGKGKGKSGFLQFLTPIPNSYPGISILTDDIGEIAGENGCSCGRKGKFFIFRKRNEAAELKGCGDTI